MLQNRKIWTNKNFTIFFASYNRPQWAPHLKKFLISDWKKIKKVLPICLKVNFKQTERNDWKIKKIYVNAPLS